MGSKDNKYKNADYRLFFTNGRTAKYTCLPKMIADKVKGDPKIEFAQEIIKTA